MSYPLAAIAKRAGRRKSISAKPITPTQARQDDLALIYLAVVRGWSAAAREQILPAYGALLDRLTRDDEQSAVGAALAAAAVQAGATVSGQRQRLAQWLAGLGRWHADRFAATIKAAVGIDPRMMMQPQETAPSIALALEHNAALLQSVNDEIKGRVAERVWAAAAVALPLVMLRRQLRQIIARAVARARFIAAEQTTEVSAALDEVRQKEAGLGSYQWHHGASLHPRDWHLARDGKVFGWRVIPPGDMPGIPAGCTCRKRPRIDLD